MNQSKFSLADLFSVLAALAFGFVCFMGANFLNINNDKVWGMPHTAGCLVMALVCSVVLLATAIGAKFLKRTSGNFKISFVGEVFLLTIFVFFAVFLVTKTSPFTHYFTVTAQKSEINSKLHTSIRQAEKMFAAYESYADNRENLYNRKLKSVVAAKRINPTEYGAFGFRYNGVSDDKQIETKMFTVHAELFPTNFSNKKDVATKWLQHAKKTTSNWKPIGIVGVVNNIEENSEEWLSALVSLSQVRQQGEQATDFIYNLSFDDVKTHFTILKGPSGLSIGLAVLAYVLMLLSWFVTKRSTRFPGVKLLFSLGVSSENEL